MSTPTAPTMQALVLAAPHGALIPTWLPRPQAAAGQVLVRIHASGVNPLDTKIRAGAAEHAQQPLPAVLGMDLAGVVAEVGQGVSRFKVGDAVYGFTGGIGGLQGSLAQYAAVDARLLAHKPGRLTMRQAAALSLVFITAWEGLVDRANVRSGHKVLVHGGAGGVGHVAVQPCSWPAPGVPRCLPRARRRRPVTSGLWARRPSTMKQLRSRPMSTRSPTARASISFTTPWVVRYWMRRLWQCAATRAMW